MERTVDYPLETISTQTGTLLCEESNEVVVAVGQRICFYILPISMSKQKQW